MNPKNNKEKALDLINQLILISKQIDEENKNADKSKYIGQSFYVFHLNQLKDLIKEI